MLYPKPFILPLAEPETSILNPQPRPLLSIDMKYFEKMVPKLIFADVCMLTVIAENILMMGWNLA